MVCCKHTQCFTKQQTSRSASAMLGWLDWSSRRSRLAVSSKSQAVFVAYRRPNSSVPDCFEIKCRSTQLRPNLLMTNWKVQFRSLIQGAGLVGGGVFTNCYFKYIWMNECMMNVDGRLVSGAMSTFATVNLYWDQHREGLASWATSFLSGSKTWPRLKLTRRVGDCEIVENTYISNM